MPGLFLLILLLAACSVIITSNLLLGWVCAFLCVPEKEMTIALVVPVMLLFFVTAGRGGAGLQPTLIRVPPGLLEEVGWLVGCSQLLLFSCFLVFFTFNARY